MANVYGTTDDWSELNETAAIVATALRAVLFSEKDRTVVNRPQAGAYKENCAKMDRPQAGGYKEKLLDEQNALAIQLFA